MDHKTLHNAFSSESLMKENKIVGVMMYDIGAFFIYKDELAKVLSLNNIVLETKELDFISSVVISQMIHELFITETLLNIDSLAKTIISNLNSVFEELCINHLIEEDVEHQVRLMLIDVYNHLGNWLHYLKLHNFARYCDTNIDLPKGYQQLTIDDIHINFDDGASQMYIIFKLIERT